MQHHLADDEVTIVEDNGEPCLSRKDPSDVVFVAEDNPIALSTATRDAFDARFSHNPKRARRNSDEVVIVSDQPGCSRAARAIKQSLNNKKLARGDHSSQLCPRTCSSSEIAISDDESGEEVMCVDDEDSCSDDIVFLDDEKEIETNFIRSPSTKKRRAGSPALKNRMMPLFVNDLESLSEKKYVSDGIINCCLQVLHQKLPEEQKSAIHIFLTFFYERLLRWDTFHKSDRQRSRDVDIFDESGSKRTRDVDLFYKSGSQWTRDVDIFSKKFVLFPICENHHWFIVVVCNPGLILPHQSSINQPKGTGVKSFKPSILVFCSLGLEHLRAVTIVRQYLRFELLQKKNIQRSFEPDDLPSFNPIVPRQPNGHDCGIYLLHYVELMLENPFPFLEANIPDLSNWFDFKDVQGKREQIKCFISDKGLVTEGRT